MPGSSHRSERSRRGLPTTRGRRYHEEPYGARDEAADEDADERYAAGQLKPGSEGKREEPDHGHDQHERYGERKRDRPGGMPRSGRAAGQRPSLECERDQHRQDEKVSGTWQGQRKDQRESHSEPAVSQDSRACKHKSSNMDVIDETAGLGAEEQCRGDGGDNRVGVQATVRRTSAGF